MQIDNVPIKVYTFRIQSLIVTATTLAEKITIHNHAKDSVKMPLIYYMYAHL